jgi:DNA-binding protein YbaB
VELGEDFDQMLTRSRELLRSMQSRPAGDAPEVEGEGEAAGGLVRVVAADGRLSSVELDPRVMRMPSAELAEQVLTAANAALDLAAARAPVGDGAGVVDPRALAEEVAEIQDQGVRQMAAISRAISAAVAQMREATR